MVRITLDGTGTTLTALEVNVLALLMDSTEAGTDTVLHGWESIYDDFQAIADMSDEHRFAAAADMEINVAFEPHERRAITAHVLAWVEFLKEDLELVSGVDRPTVMSCIRKLGA